VIGPHHERVQETAEYAAMVLSSPVSIDVVSPMGQLHCTILYRLLSTELVNTLVTNIDEVIELS